MASDPKYGIHAFSTSGEVPRDYFTASTLTEAVERFSSWADSTGASRDGQTSATIDLYDSRDTADESHSDYPLGLIEFGPRGGVVVNTNI